MKQLYEEILHISAWCGACPHSDISKNIKKNEDNGEIPDGIQPVKLRSPFWRDWTADFFELIDPNEKTKEEEEMELWESSYENRLEDYPSGIFCPYIRSKGLKLNIHREFIIPDDERELLRLLDKISICYTEECTFSRFKPHSSVDNMMKIAMAKIDFALIEQGKDYGKIMSDLYFPYYDRKHDIYECGYSHELIRFYLDKYNITLLGYDDYEAKNQITQVENFRELIEFQDAFADGLCAENGILLVSKAEYTRYATEKYKIKSSYKKEWRRFDNIFIDDKGKIVSFRSFMQSYRDQGL